ncbi:secreted RxLR effector protein 161-like [Carya illinoinensis]|uniref:secreted RxLR effector protein 161-like n=1 Tax=Carya illinoinensis TaxID=32201 RepID=UPI001C71B81C|nr:secreted RxLR effector protein 161-like [Carya illinoinensis]
MKGIPYASAVGSLMYAHVCIRLDIGFVVGLLGRYQSNPGLDHWKAAKKVLQYLQGTKDYRLTYRHTDRLEVVCYSDSDFVGFVDTKKSTSVYIFLLARGAISWRSYKQTIVAMSTMEAKFIACCKATTEALWLRNFLSGLKIVDLVERPLQIFCDSTTAVFFSKNNKCSSRSKYIDIKYLSVRESIKRNEVFIECISAELMIVDPMPKGLPLLQFKGHVDNMGLVNLFYV